MCHSGDVSSMTCKMLHYWSFTACCQQYMIISSLFFVDPHLDASPTCTIAVIAAVPVRCSMSTLLHVTYNVKGDKGI